MAFPFHIDLQNYNNYFYKIIATYSDIYLDTSITCEWKCIILYLT